MLPQINAFLRQDLDEPSNAADTWTHLHQLVGGA